MLISDTIQQALFALLFLAIIATAWGRPKNFLALLGFSIPLLVPRVDIGIGLDWYKIIGPMAIGLALLRRPQAVGLKASRTSGVLVFITYVVLVSSVWMFLEYNYLERYRLAAAMEMGGGIAQYKFRMPIQLGSFLGQVLAIFAVPLWASSLEDCRQAITGAVAGVVASVVAGGISYLLVGLATVNTSGMMGVLVYSDYSIARLGGLSGEPKLLGILLAIFLVLKLCQQVFGAKIAQPMRMFVFLSLALFATFSTSGWVAAVAGIIIVALLAVLRPSKSRLGLLAVISGLGAFLALSVGFVGTMLESRGFGRLFGESGNLDEQRDVYVFRVFAAHPLNVVFGYGSGGIDFAVIPYVEWLHLKYKRTVGPGVMIARLLGDLGVVGLALLLWVAGRWSRYLAKRGHQVASAFMVAGLATALFGSTIGLTLYFFLAGALLSEAHLETNPQPGFDEAS